MKSLSKKLCRLISNKELVVFLIFLQLVVFKNIEVNKWSGKKEDLPEIFWERGKIPVGWLVEQVGMKGFTIGSKNF